MELRALMDLHTHTLASGHAYSTLKENLEEAKKMGLKVLGTSEHARMMPGTAPLIYFQNFKVIPKEVDGVRLVNGIEANIFACNKSHTLVLMGTDSHICYEIGHFEDSMALLKELDFPAEQVINFDVDRLGYVLRKH